MADQFTAKSVVIDKIFRAHCNIPGCVWKIRSPGWRPGEYATHAEANADRQKHIDWHNQQARQAAADA